MAATIIGVIDQNATNVLDGEARIERPIGRVKVREAHLADG
jgi:hypothetical protein